MKKSDWAPKRSCWEIAAGPGPVCVTAAALSNPTSQTSQSRNQRRGRGRLASKVHSTTGHRTPVGLGPWEKSSVPQRPRQRLAAGTESSNTATNQPAKIQLTSAITDSELPSRRYPVLEYGENPRQVHKSIAGGQ
ncbi:hypothetical protein Ddc_09729 [Ditylenchus destructor]|nr:hypothetical protein Ddc_09729 [Ditylenchus destructor]